MSQPVETEAGSSPKRAQWKIVIAADQPWAGTIYTTKRGDCRLSFDCAEDFLSALMRLTGWRPPDPR